MRKSSSREGAAFTASSTPKCGLGKQELSDLTQPTCPAPSRLDYPHLRDFSTDPMAVFRGDMSALREIVKLALED